ncbi:MAG: HEAT repeat domain-containing protein [Planctomycetes bacterium]|nr:HEAT repeat domain-containing protein [Planctomycetota bacterium]
MLARLVLVGFSIIALAIASSAKDVDVPFAKKPNEKEPEKKTPDTKPPEPPRDPIKAAEKLLEDFQVATDPKSLLQFFKTRTLNDDDRAKLLTTIRRLGDEDFDVRETASDELTNAGLAALPILRAASRDRDVEVARRVEICLKKINQDQETSRIIAAATLLAHHKVDGTVSTLFAYLPCVPDDEMIAEGLRNALVAYTKKVGKADPLLLKCLEDQDLTRRAIAVQVIGEALPGERALIRRLLNDSEAKVRYLAGSTLAKAGDEEALPALLKLLSDGPIEYAFQVEDMLCQLLDSEERPPATLNGNDAGMRAKARDAWAKWVMDRQKDKKLKLARLNEVEPLRGLTLIVEVDGGGVNGGRIWECGPDGKQRWELGNLGGPVDVQVLPGGRLLIPEYYNSRVTERDREGKILWESPRLNSNTVGAQRLPNGNTLIATMADVVEYTRTNQKVADFPKTGGTVYQAIRHRNGHTFVLSGNSITEYGTDNKQLRSINIGSLSGWGGFEILPNGNFLVAYYGQGNKYAEVGQDGKVVWEHSTTGSPTRLDPTRIQRLRNGNTVVAGGNVMWVAEFDRDKKEIWKVATKGRPFSVRRY